MTHDRWLRGSRNGVLTLSSRRRTRGMAVAAMFRSRRATPPLVPRRRPYMAYLKVPPEIQKAGYFLDEVQTGDAAGYTAPEIWSGHVGDLLVVPDGHGLGARWPVLRDVSLAKLGPSLDNWAPPQYQLLP